MSIAERAHIPGSVNPVKRALGATGQGAHVFVGLSGGVDSGTSAAILKERGYEVTGVFIKIWQPEFIECTWREDRLDAMRVAATLGIPFREIDLSDEYKNEVVENIVADYARGITPNPDVLCNEKIKFGAFFDWAMKSGADIVATGHYARVLRSIEVEPRSSASRLNLDEDCRLVRGVDINKDQSYFLYRLSEKQLERCMFPIGDITKEEVRARAKKFGLPVAEKPDSQGLCFVGDVSMPDFLRRYIKVENGNVLAANGEVVGEHDGAPLYTIGQRHGFTIFGESAREPHYITEIDTKANTIAVSVNKEDAMRKEISLRDIHWIGGAAPTSKITAQVRYRTNPTAVRLRGNLCSFAEPQLCSPGQSIVFYDGEICLGGAIIAI